MINKKTRNIFISFVMFISTAIVTYLFCFQTPEVISLRYLFYSLCAGFVCSLICWIILIKNQDQIENIFVNPVLIFSILLTMFFLVIHGIPDIYLFAPSENITISIPSIQDGGMPIAVESIQTGAENIWYTGIPLTNNLRVIEGAVLLVPKDNEISSITIYARVWKRIYFYLQNVQPDMPVWLGVNNKTEEYYVPQDNLNSHVITSMTVDGFWKIKLLSDVTVFCSIFVLIYFVSLCVYLFYEDTEVNFDFTKLFLILFILILAVQFLFLNPLRVSLNRDSGVYLHVAKGLLSGQVPYRDIWDHKGPSIFMIDALALSTGLGRWGIWMMEMVFSVSVLIILYKLLSRSTGVIGVFWGLFVFTKLLFVFIDGGNMVEEYAIFPGILCLYIFTKLNEISTAKKQLGFFVIGMLAASIFLFRPNLVSIFLSINLYILGSGIQKKELKNSLISLLFMVSGFAAILTTVSLFFISKSAFMDFVNAVLVYNFAYSDVSGLNSLWRNVFWIFRRLPFYMYITIIGWVFLVIRKIGFKKQIPDSGLVTIVLTGFLIEVFIYNLSGRNYDHYFLALLPYLCLILAYFSAGIAQLIRSKNIFTKKDYTGFICLAFLLVICFVEIFPYLKEVNEVTAEKIEQDKILMEASEFVSDGDYLLIWGAETAINYLMDVPAPNRFIYQFPLMNCEFITRQDVSEFIDDLGKKSPLIFDSHSTNGGLISLVSHEKNNCDLLNPLFEYFKNSYEEIGKLDNGWVVYKAIQ